MYIKILLFIQYSGPHWRVRFDLELFTFLFAFLYMYMLQYALCYVNFISRNFVKSNNIFEKYCEKSQSVYTLPLPINPNSPPHEFIQHLRSIELILNY